MSKQRSISRCWKNDTWKKRNKLKAYKRPVTLVEAVTKAERNCNPHAFMTWLDQYLQMREGQINIAPATREDDTKEYHINSDNAVTNPTNSKTS